MSENILLPASQSNDKSYTCCVLLGGGAPGRLAGNIWLLACSRTTNRANVAYCRDCPREVGWKTFGL